MVTTQIKGGCMDQRQQGGMRNMTEGSPARHIFCFALPLLAGSFFQQLYNMVDTIIVGRYVGADALAAVGSTVLQ